MKSAAIAIFLTMSFAAQAAEVTRAESHVFYSSFWINLHDRLYHEATARKPEPHEFNAAERSAWDEALAIYKKDVGRKHPVFDESLVAITRVLAKTADDPVEPKGLPASITAALKRAAPVYRAHDWKTDDLANRFWIAYTAGMLRETGPEMIAEVSRLYEVQWPKTLHIDAVPFADPFGGSTPAPTPDLYHTMAGPRRPGTQGFAALELMMHEPMHHFDEPMEAAIARAAQKAGVKTPDKLDHAILFYTAGEVTRRALARRGIDYTPIAIAEGIHKRSWPQYVWPIEEHWKAYMDGKITRDVALERIVATFKQ